MVFKLAWERTICLLRRSFAARVSSIRRWTSWVDQEWESSGCQRVASRLSLKRSHCKNTTKWCWKEIAHHKWHNFWRPWWCSQMPISTKSNQLISWPLLKVDDTEKCNSRDSSYWFKSNTDRRELKWKKRKSSVTFWKKLPITGQSRIRTWQTNSNSRIGPKDRLSTTRTSKNLEAHSSSSKIFI